MRGQLARRRLARDLFLAVTAVSLVGAGVGGWLFADKAMDMVLLQLVFYGCWACLLGARVGGYFGAMMEEDHCSELDMGALSAMGSMVGTLSAGLVGTAAVGIGLATIPWWAVWAVAVLLAVAHAGLGAVRPVHLQRLPHLDKRGRLLGPDGLALPPERQPLRMPDRVAILLAVSAVIVLGLTLAMAVLMGSDLGHPVMMAPMMYGMFGTMVGGMLGGWLAGLLDEHEGLPEHDNPVMVSGMALMAGMMGGMPSGMIGGMMAIMGTQAVGLTVAAGLGLAVVAWFAVMRGRYRFATGVPVVIPEVRAVTGSTAVSRVTGTICDVCGATGLLTGGRMTTILVDGMSCGACVLSVTNGLGRLPGVRTVKVELSTGVVRVDHEPDRPSIEALHAAVEDLGYEVRVDATRPPR